MIFRYDDISHEISCRGLRTHEQTHSHTAHSRARAFAFALKLAGWMARRQAGQAGRQGRQALSFIRKMVRRAIARACEPSTSIVGDVGARANDRHTRIRAFAHPRIRAHARKQAGLHAQSETWMCVCALTHTPRRRRRRGDASQQTCARTLWRTALLHCASKRACAANSRAPRGRLRRCAHPSNRSDRSGAF